MRILSLRERRNSLLVLERRTGGAESRRRMWIDRFLVPQPLRILKDGVGSDPDVVVAKRRVRAAQLHSKPICTRIYIEILLPFLRECEATAGDAEQWRLFRFFVHVSAAIDHIRYNATARRVIYGVTIVEAPIRTPGHFT